MHRNCNPLLYATIASLWLHGASASLAAPRLMIAMNVQDFGAEQLRIGDLDGDGGPDLLLVQSRYATREITCLTALSIEGRVLWQNGSPSLENGRIYSDLPVQVYDWDHDGQNEVLYVRQAKYLEPWNGGETFRGRAVRERAERYEGHATMVVLDGKTGKEESSFALPAPADDCFLLADLTGRGRRADLVVKDRYWNAWGISHEGRELWHWSGSTGHFPAVADVDRDGRDEVFFGYALIDDDGKVLFSHDPNQNWERRMRVEEPKDVRAYRSFLTAPIHSDANFIVKRPNGQFDLLFGNGGPHCLSVDGTELWSNENLGEAQHVVAGRFRADSEYQVAVIDRTPRDGRRPRNADSYADLYLFDHDGRQIWHRRQEKGSWMIGCTGLNWNGDRALRSLLVYGFPNGQPAQIVDGDGKVVRKFPMIYRSNHHDTEQDDSEVSLALKNFYPLTADVWGDSRDEVILFGARGLCIYTNPLPGENESEYNETLYPGT